jgi:hypothetical protein
MGGASCTEKTMQEQEANNLVSSLQDACGHDCGTSSLHAGARGGLWQAGGNNNNRAVEQ